MKSQKSKGADYCLALKRNQKGLYTEVQQIFADAQERQWEGIQHSFHQTLEKDHGRIEIRRYWTFASDELKQNTEQWAGLQSIGVVESIRRNGAETTTSIPAISQQFSS